MSSYVSYSSTQTPTKKNFTLQSLQYDFPQTKPFITSPTEDYTSAFKGRLSEIKSPQDSYSDYQSLSNITNSIQKVLDVAKLGKFYSTSLKKYLPLGENNYKQKCTSGPATFYKDALGIELNGLWWDTGSPKTAKHTNITKQGFSEKWSGSGQDVKNGNWKGVVKPGDIMVLFANGKHGPTAHAEMWDGQKWVSDTNQSKAWVYGNDNGRLGNRSAILYRNDSLWKGQNGGRLQFLKNGNYVNYISTETPQNSVEIPEEISSSFYAAPNYFVINKPKQIEWQQNFNDKLTNPISIAINQKNIPIKFEQGDQVKFAKTAYNAYKNLGCTDNQALLLAAQDSLESTWGTKVTGTHNYGGIKGNKSNGTLVNTHEVINGKSVPTQAFFRNFNSYEEYAKYKFDLLSSQRYHTFDDDDITNMATRIKKGGYATDPDYINKLVAQVNSIKRRL